MIFLLMDIHEKGAKWPYLMVSIGFLDVLKPALSPTYRGPVITAIRCKYQGPNYFVIP